MDPEKKIRSTEVVEEAEQAVVEFTVRPEGTDSEIYCRRMPREISRSLAQKYQKVDWKRGQRNVYVPENRQVEHDKDILDYIILGWKHVTRKGQPLEPTRDNKYKLPTSVQLEILEGADVAAVEGDGARPNSEGSSSA